MVLTNERADLLADYLTKDTAKAKELLELTPEEAMAKINEDGFDFSVDEIRDFGEQLQHIASVNSDSEELDAEKLDTVSGGAFITLTAAGLATVFATCCGAGWAMAGRHGW
jgi:lipoate-protein ligase A